MYMLHPPILLLYCSNKYTTLYEHYTLTLHDALPICELMDVEAVTTDDIAFGGFIARISDGTRTTMTRREVIVIRSEEHTSELQSLTNLVCRLLLEKKKFE